MAAVYNYRIIKGDGSWYGASGVSSPMAAIHAAYSGDPSKPGTGALNAYAEALKATGAITLPNGAVITLISKKEGKSIADGLISKEKLPVTHPVVLVAYGITILYLIKEFLF